MDWITHDLEIFAHVSKTISKMGTGIYGPQTFQMMEGYWPQVLQDPESSELEIDHAKWYQRAQKVVRSRTRKSLTNKEATLIGGDPLTAEIEGLKAKAQKDLMIFGSPRLTQSLASLGLIDEYIVNVNPILLGSGIRMFEDARRTNLTLLNVTP